MQYLCGGVVAFLESSNNEKLLNFYTNNGFSKFDIRKTNPTSKESHELVQFLKLL